MDAHVAPGGTTQSEGGPTAYHYYHWWYRGEKWMKHQLCSAAFETRRMCNQYYKYNT